MPRVKDFRRTQKPKSLLALRRSPRSWRACGRLGRGFAVTGSPFSIRLAQGKIVRLKPDLLEYGRPSLCDGRPLTEAAPSHERERNSGQFTPVYGCLEALVKLPLFAIFRSLEWSSSAGTAAAYVESESEDRTFPMCFQAIEKHSWHVPRKIAKMMRPRCSLCLNGFFRCRARTCDEYTKRTVARFKGGKGMVTPTIVRSRQGWVQPIGRNTISDGGLHPPYGETTGHLNRNDLPACYLRLDQARTFVSGRRGTPPLREQEKSGIRFA